MSSYRHGYTTRMHRLFPLLIGVVLASAATGATVVHQATAASVVNTLATDDFSRTTSNGLGAPRGGAVYVLTNSAATKFSVSGGLGRVNALRPGASAGAHITASALDLAVHSEFIVPSTASSRLGTYYSIELRHQPDGSAYRVKLYIGPGGLSSLTVSRSNKGKETQIGGAFHGVKLHAGQAVVIEGVVTGTSTVSIVGRMFVRGATVPHFQVSQHDSSASRIARAGSVGIWVYVSKASVATSLAFDNFRATSVSPAPAAKPPVAKPPAKPAPAKPATKIYRSANFNGDAVASVKPATFSNDLGAVNAGVSAFGDMTIAKDSRGTGNVLRTELTKGTIRADGNGAVIDVPLVQQYDKACMSYDIKFDAAFDWSLGGKLPGLEGVAPGVPASAPSGGHPTSAGWSGRLMWVGPKAYSWAGPSNMVVSYMYHPGQTSQYGDNVRWNKAFVAGKWHTVKQCYAMNTVGQKNGVLQAWMDGSLVVSLPNFVYRTRSDVHINYIAWELFRGGNTLAWAGSRTGYVDIDNVQITSQ
ncbi:MAG: hypothetical protein M3Z66_19810 [Chloroflexota bacterium]|nr:hypothetical protein [Chloroflexota bacterium]